MKTKHLVDVMTRFTFSKTLIVTMALFITNPSLGTAFSTSKLSSMLGHNKFSYKTFEKVNFAGQNNFDGKDDFLQIAENAIKTDQNGSFSVELFVKLERNETFHTDENGYTRFNSSGTIFSFLGNQIRLTHHPKVNALLAWHESMDSNGYDVKIANVMMDDLYDSYHHIVVVKDEKNNKLELYINGVLRNAVCTHKPLTQRGKSFIGKKNLNDTYNFPMETDNAANFFKGEIVSFSIYHRALTRRSITSFYHRNKRRFDEYNKKLIEK